MNVREESILSTTIVQHRYYPETVLRVGITNDQYRYMWVKHAIDTANRKAMRDIVYIGRMRRKRNL